MHGWLGRGELDDVLNSCLGADNVHLHNELILCLLHNARCRYLPAELVSQVPASSRGKVVHAAVKPHSSRAALPPPPPSASKAALSGTSAASSPFQGKRTEGLLSNADRHPAAANGGGRGFAAGSNGASHAGRGAATAAAEEAKEASSTVLMPAPLKIEVGSDGGREPGGLAAAVKPEARAAGGVTNASPPSAGGEGASFSSGGRRRRDDDRIPPAARMGTGTAAAAATGERERRRALAPDENGDGDGDAVLEEARLLEEEILCHFGPGSDLWRPWSGCGAAAAATGLGREGHHQLPVQPASSGGSGGGAAADSGKKRSAWLDESPGSTVHRDQRRGGEAERRTKALKSEQGAVAAAAAAVGGPIANGGSGRGLGEKASSNRAEKRLLCFFSVTVSSLFRGGLVLGGWFTGSGFVCACFFGENEHSRG